MLLFFRVVGSHHTVCRRRTPTPPPGTRCSPQSATRIPNTVRTTTRSGVTKEPSARCTTPSTRSSPSSCQMWVVWVVGYLFFLHLAAFFCSEENSGISLKATFFPLPCPFFNLSKTSAWSAPGSLHVFQHNSCWFQIQSWERCHIRVLNFTSEKQMGSIVVVSFVNQ